MKQNKFKSSVVKKLILVFALSTGLFFGCEQPNKGEILPEDDFYTRLKTDAEFASQFREWEKGINDYLDHQKEEIQVFALRSTIVTIPVVVHVIHSGETIGTGKNIAQTVIDDQIRILNEDFARINPRYITPTGVVATALGAFGTLAANTRIQFELAKRSPTCTVTTGVTRTTGISGTYAFNALGGTASARNPVKFNSTNGEDAWDTQKYFNIWVCDLTGGKGYSSEASELISKPTEDGVVIDYQSFGVVSATSSLGQSATFYTGRWLGLGPLFPCAGDDGVADTPQQSPNTGCPTAAPDPTGCTAAAPNAMFINFMSSRDDACRVMFTTGQADRMNATLFTTRAGLLGSEALTPPPAITTDLYAKDTDDDLGVEPNIESTVMYLSDDIWVRNNPDGLTNQEHQNPIGAATNYVYVRVRNRGCAASAGGSVRLWWAKASSGLSYPSPWTGGVPIPSGGGFMGNQIGAPISSGAVTASGSTIVTFTWATPDPALYATDFGTDNGHFCLLADVNSEAPASWVPGLWDLVYQKNGVIWKNLEVLGAGTPIPEQAEGRQAGGLAGNFSDKPKDIKLEFAVPENETSPFGWGDILFEMNDKMYDSWQQNGQKSNNMEFEGKIGRLNKDSAFVANITMQPNTYYPIHIKFKQKPGAPEQRNIYKLLMNQYELVDGQYKITGGQVFILKAEHQPIPEGKDNGGDNPIPTKYWWWAAAGILILLMLWRWLRKK